MARKDPATQNKEVPPPADPDASADSGLAITELIDANDPAALPSFFDGLQGNILKGHGRDHIRLLFLRLTAPAPEARAAIRNFVNLGHVQSAREQRQHEVRFKKFGVPGPLFANVMLSASGYRKLGFDLTQFDEQPTLQTFGSEVVTFAKGAKNSDAIATLSDPPVDTWEKPFRDDIDALILLADDQIATLVTVLNDTIAAFQDVATVVYIQSGDALRNANSDAIEHFGYIDGRSQPVFFKQDLEKEIAQFDGEDPALPGANLFVKFDPSAAKELVLVKDPFGPAGAQALGSYFVFRKLEQDVRGFKQQEQSLADALGLVGEQRELAGAYVVGRFEDGTPVVMRDEDGLSKPIPNNFDYASDPEGTRCPFHSHLRKMNPRGDTVRAFATTPQQAVDTLAAERGRRIARRGITYGDRTADPSDPAAIPLLPTRDVGLLFMCFQANIPQQFAFLQQSWANNEAFVKAGVGVDPVIGQLRDIDQPVAQRCPLTWGQRGDIRYDFSGFVTMKGGEFFFAPSIPFLVTP